MSRPKSPPRERMMRRVTRRTVAEEIYKGTFPANLAERHGVAAEQLAGGKGRRMEADSLAEQILGVSVRTIRYARNKKRAPMGREGWDELVELIDFAFGPRAPE